MNGNLVEAARKKVLIVDDEEDITWSIAKGLSKDNRIMDVVCVNNGSDALDFLSKNRVDLLVTDIRMPGVHGRQLFEQVKQRHPQLHVFVMTAYGSRDVNEWLKGFGAVGYIEKPFEISELRKRIVSAVGENGRKKKRNQGKK